MLAAAFADPVMDAQATFRALMDAFARPGTVHRVRAIDGAPVPLTPTAAAVASTLLDHETTVHLDAPLNAARDVGEWLAFHTGARVTRTLADAAFVLVSDGHDLPPLDACALGNDAYPDRAATLIVAVESVTSGRPLVLTGPGIETSQHIAVAGLPDDIVPRLAANRALFPRGVDLVLCAAEGLIALPRTTRVVEA